MGGVQAVLPVLAWLEGRGGRPEGYCHRAMFAAARYVVDNGIKWANLPARCCRTRTFW
ncbi:hypothetical protein OOK36_35695 [Streptomyces sp. NBC_00365]|uniref:transposase n=1 Tax=Streptomyces sp. NBC_00365 TaxID=2975726 RepID=UPI00225BA55C|nr:transposase [Streptomyces sp. NBC_00365]MCX5094116.1 hypothetical protein [Streptomyces sp. NBC_00365]